MSFFGLLGIAGIYARQVQVSQRVDLATRFARSRAGLRFASCRSFRQPRSYALVFFSKKRLFHRVYFFVIPVALTQSNLGQTVQRLQRLQKLGIFGAEKVGHGQF